MMRIQRLLITILLAATLSACTAGQTTAPPITQQNPLDPNYSKLQLAVGTANIFGVASGLNVVSTLRQPNGTSAVGVDTPVITGPFAFAIGPAAGGALGADPYMTLVNSGPSLLETSGVPVSIRGTPQSVVPGTPFCDGPGPCPGGVAPNTTTFGQSGGVFAMGLAPYNHVGTTGQAYSYQPYPQPLYNNTGHNNFVPWGGPPAFDPDNNGMGTRDGLIPLGTDSFGVPFFLGVGEGVMVFNAVTPATGAYTLTTQIATLGNNGQPITGNIAVSATLSSLALLPLVNAPVVTPTGAGNATFTATVPAGVTQAYVQIIDYGPNAGPTHASLTAPNCQSSKGTKFAPVYYTVEITASGTYSLGPLHGPNTALSGTSVTPSPSICTAAQNTAAGTDVVGDNISVQMIGFDYPAYQAALSLTQATTPQAPQITGPSGQSDITISIAQEEDYPGYAQVPLLSSRRPLTRSFATRTSTAPRASAEVYHRLGVPAPR
jgi:hypothetical protein